MYHDLYNLTHRKRSPLPEGEGYKQQFIFPIDFFLGLCYSVA